MIAVFSCVNNNTCKVVDILDHHVPTEDQNVDLLEDL